MRPPVQRFLTSLLCPLTSPITRECARKTAVIWKRPVEHPACQFVFLRLCCMYVSLPADKAARRIQEPLPVLRLPLLWAWSYFKTTDRSQPRAFCAHLAWEPESNQIPTPCDSHRHRQCCLLAASYADLDSPQAAKLRVFLRLPLLPQDTELC